MHTFKEALQYYDGTLSKFIGSEDSLTCLTSHDPCNITKQGHHATHKIPIWTRNGKVLYDAESYMDIVESFKPDMYTILSDGDTNMSSAEKRITKSMNNSLYFYKECLKRHRNSAVLKNAFVVAPIVGGYKIVARENYISSLLQDIKDIDGFLIDGLHNNGPETEFLNYSEIDPIIRCVLVIYYS